jgi:hypothetical protein
MIRLRSQQRGLLIDMEDYPISDMVQACQLVNKFLGVVTGSLIGSEFAKLR